MLINKKILKKLIKEVLDERSTSATKTLSDMINNLSDYLHRSVVKDDKGNYNINDVDPYLITIKPIVRDIFDLQVIKDKSDRKKYVFITFEDLKIVLKNLLASNTKNYVDLAYDKCVENSKDIKTEKNENIKTNMANLNSKYKQNTVKTMNKEEDNPDMHMQIVKPFKKLKDFKETKIDYKPPKLPKELQSIVLKYKKNNKLTTPRNKFADL